jgi:acetyl esterase
MPLHPQVRLLLDQFAATGSPPIEEMSLADARAMMSTLAQLTAPVPEGVESELITMSTLQGDIPVRLYKPSGASASPRPLLVWLHGGGWVIGDLESADPTARDLAVRTGAVVASVDYPLAPEHPFPVAPEACHAAASWLAGHARELGADPARVAIGGDSAGGNLAAVTALLARDRGGPEFKFQLLVYPVTDCLMSYPSVKENGEGYLLTASAMHWFVDHYLPSGTDPRDPAASPIDAGDLNSLPPALVITAEFDPLRDEGEAYAARLERAGVPVTTSRYDGMIHGFFGMTGVLDSGREAVREAAEALNKAFSS